MTLNEFVEDLQSDIIAFQLMWANEHLKDPEMYPLEIPEDNDGVWWEQFVAFCEMRGK